MTSFQKKVLSVDNIESPQVRHYVKLKNNIRSLKPKKILKKRNGALESPRVNCLFLGNFDLKIT
jgi:hypothetical protein